MPKWSLIENSFLLKYASSKLRKWHTSCQRDICFFILFKMYQRKRFFWAVIESNRALIITDIINAKHFFNFITHDDTTAHPKITTHQRVSWYERETVDEQPHLQRLVVTQISQPQKIFWEHFAHHGLEVLTCKRFVHHGFAVLTCSYTQFINSRDDTNMRTCSTLPEGVKEHTRK